MRRKDIGVRVWNARTFDQLLSIVQHNDDCGPQISADASHAWTIEKDAVKAWYLGNAELLTGASVIAPGLARLTAMSAVCSKAICPSL